MRAGFNPVFYALHSSDVLRLLYEGMAGLREFDGRSWSPTASVARDLEDLTCEEGHPLGSTEDVSNAQYELEQLGELVAGTRQRLHRFLAFVKTFHEREFSTIYPEREWRSVGPFEFTLADIAMIVLPKSKDGTSFFHNFLKDQAATPLIKAGIPIVPWEELIEH